MTRFSRIATPLRRGTGLLLLVVVLTTCAVAPGQQTSTIAGDEAAARIAWWREARFGLFIHWGVYAIPGRGEWVQFAEQIPVDEYARLAGQFHPDKFDPDQWAAIAKDAGMKYAVMTARHHDGFAMFDEPGSDFTSMRSAAHRDFVAEYTAAMRKAGLGVGLYYSPLDWRFPGFYFPQLYQANAVQLREQYHRQLNELASHYGKIDILWFDGGGVDWLGFGGLQFNGSGWQSRPRTEHYTGAFTWQDDAAVGNLRKLQPSVIVNDRTDAPADFLSREGDRALGGFDNKHPWELCTTIGDRAWGYEIGAKVKPLDDLLRLLIGAAGRDGNFILNVGPRPDGQIEPAQVERLHEIGQWMGQYGQSIYGTRGGPYLPGDYGVSTYRGNTVYVHILKQAEGVLMLPALPAKVLGCTVLTGGTATCTQTVAGVDIGLRGNLPAVDTIVALSLDASASGIEPIATPVTAGK